MTVSSGIAPAVAWSERVTPEAAGITTTHQRRASRRANWLNIVLIQFNAFANQPIKVRRFRKSVMPANIGPSQIVGNDKQDVGTRGLSEDAGVEEAENQRYRQPRCQREVTVCIHKLLSSEKDSRLPRIEWATFYGLSLMKCSPTPIPGVLKAQGTMQRDHAFIGSEKITCNNLFRWLNPSVMV